MNVKLTLQNNEIIIYLNKTYIKNIDLQNKKILENYLNKLLNKIKNKYELYISGYYDVKIYLSEEYGIIINIEKENLDYPEYFAGEIDMNISVIEDRFLYEVENIDIPKSILKKLEKYKFLDKIYLHPKENLSDIELGVILENTKLIYGEKAKQILAKSRKIEVI